MSNFAERYNSPIDALLELRNDRGGRLAQNDDFAATTDSRIDYTVAKDVYTVDVAVSDRLGLGNSQCIYRLVVNR